MAIVTTYRNEGGRDQNGNQQSLEFYRKNKKLTVKDKISFINSCPTIHCFSSILLIGFSITYKKLQISRLESEWKNL
jgi:hypothetical protein